MAFKRPGFSMRIFACLILAACLSVPLNGVAQTPPPVAGDAPAPSTPPVNTPTPVGTPAPAPAPIPPPSDKKENRGEAFAAPNFRELVITSMMLDAYDNNNNEVIDEYAKLMYCSLYLEKFKSDFEWNNIRRELGNKIRAKREYFRTHYEISGPIFLGRYSFETQDFPFVKDTALVNVGSLTLLSMGRRAAQAESRLCGDQERSSLFPSNYVFILQQPLTLDRIKMPMDEAEKLLKRMDAMHNKERALYVRFRMRLMAASGLDSRNNPPRLLMRGELVSVDIFYDREMTKHFATVALK